MKKKPVLIGLDLQRPGAMNQLETLAKQNDLDFYIEKKSNMGINLFVEPNLDSHSVYKLTDYKEAIRKADIIVFLVAHDEFKNINTPKNKLILDFCGIKK